MTVDEHISFYVRHMYGEESLPEELARHLDAAFRAGALSVLITLTAAKDWAEGRDALVAMEAELQQWLGQGFAEAIH